MISNRETLHLRLNILWTVLYVAIGILILRLLQIQVIQNVRYVEAAERNRTQILRQTAPRGRIYDKNGDTIATNQAVFSLIFLPQSKNQDPGTLKNLARDLAPELHQDPQKLLQVLYRAIREESAIRLAEKLPPKTMFKLSELRTLYPGVYLAVEARRFYPYGAFASHLLGYTGKMDENSWKTLKSQGYRIDSWVGKSGIEKLFEPELRGRDGGIRMEVDVRGGLKRILEKIPWKAGSNLYLTIDGKIQKAAEEALRTSMSKSGAAVVLNPANGNILALASIPDFDPNTLLQPDEDKPQESPGKIPEFNLAIQGTFPPGSTFKIITSAAMLEEGKVNPSEKVFCPGFFELGTHIFKCWIAGRPEKEHKWVNYVDAIKQSCDVYFYKMGLRTGGDLIEKYEQGFHLGKRTRVGLSGEASGHIFGPQERAAHGLSWYDGDTVNLSIGQGELLVTPIQMAVLISAVANRGTLWRPHFIDHIEYTEGRGAYYQQPEALGHIVLKDSTWDLLSRGLDAVVNGESGTGVSMRIPGLAIGGKTGTAQTAGKDCKTAKCQAWFVAYAGKPGEAPSLAVAVLVQHGGHGATAAIPVAKHIVETAFDIQPPLKPGIHVSTGTVIPLPVPRETPIPAVVR